MDKFGMQINMEMTLWHRFGKIGWSCALLVVRT